ncbi:hypothetical protein OH76DRAFT_1401470 [Lentinus brumalis]|uniref:Uncharacterized protein n=1 Tax=Lentinus brumalis TaxID=2498619 RepID=A0A371DGE5_9APHY|nr:hypothetical protein OH76DRAFT_1401470 [Polyporus brumalis]
MVFRLLAVKLTSGRSPPNCGLKLNFPKQPPHSLKLVVVDLDGADGLGASFQLLIAQGPDH